MSRHLLPPGASALVMVFALAALVCGYGFLAALEPGAGNWRFRVGYGAAGLLCLAAAGFVVWRGRRG